MEGGTYAQATEAGFTKSQVHFLAQLSLDIKDEMREEVSQKFKCMKKKPSVLSKVFIALLGWLDRGWYQMLLGILVGFFFYFCLAFSANASEYDCKALNKFSDSQVINLKQSVIYGSQDDLGYTLAAISWEESSAGKYRINYKTNDYGSYGINVKTIQRIDKDKNYYRTVEMIQKVVYDDFYGAHYALETLRWNLKHHKGDWRKAIAHYNAGNDWWKGKGYAEKVSIKVKTLQHCLKEVL